MLYSVLVNGRPSAPRQRPRWYTAGGEPASDEALRQAGYYPVLDAPPPWDAEREILTERPPEEWVVADGSVKKTYHVKQITPEERWLRVRARRNQLLSESDICVMPDRWDAMSSTQRAAWASYRQTLRDITAEPDPYAIVWPAPPEV